MLLLSHKFHIDFHSFPRLYSLLCTLFDFVPGIMYLTCIFSFEGKAHRTGLQSDLSKQHNTRLRAVKLHFN